MVHGSIDHLLVSPVVVLRKRGGHDDTMYPASFLRKPAATVSRSKPVCPWKDLVSKQRNRSLASCTRISSAVYLPRPNCHEGMPDRPLISAPRAGLLTPVCLSPSQREPFSVCSFNSLRRPHLFSSGRRMQRSVDSLACGFSSGVPSASKPTFVSSLGGAGIHYTRVQCSGLSPFVSHDRCVPRGFPRSGAHQNSQESARAGTRKTFTTASGGGGERHISDS